MSSLPTKGWNTQLRELITSPITIIAMTCLVGYLAFVRTFRREQPTYDDKDYEQEGHVELPAPLADLKLTLKQLANYNCHNPNNVYLVALNEIIYDVSSAPHDFGPDGKFHMLSGTDIDDFIRNRSLYDVRNKVTLLKEWKVMLEDYFYVAGEIIEDDKESNAGEEPASDETLLNDMEATVEEIPVHESIQSDDNDSLRTALDCLNDDDEAVDEEDSDKDEENESIEMGQGDGADETADQHQEQQQQGKDLSKKKMEQPANGRAG
ncbi:uncharacterized protein Dwil_GK14568 [Drosophila willistoni]|uniref:Cytochrome b5 heme-binding domain-containing protein n=1 Tax=Drosophila willistoni TaxID=7260 RepID=B4MWY1_DROWI|nr:uncharacterized protein Dwil_GK14568 [Drosophila willistoni]